MNFEEFLKQCEKVGSTQALLTTYPNAKWIATGEIGVYVYCRFIDVDSVSKDYFVIGNEVREVGQVINEYINFVNPE